jgi:hypothetical protein
MGTFAQMQNQPSELASFNLARPKMPTSGSDHHDHFIVNPNRTIGNQVVQRMSLTDTEELEARLIGTASTRFGHDFSQIPIHPSAAGTIQTKSAINQRGDKYEPEVDHVAYQEMHLLDSPLASDTRAFAEPRFGHSFGRLRVHSDAKAAWVAAIQRQNESEPSAPIESIQDQETQPVDTLEKNSREPKLYGHLSLSIRGPLTFSPWAFGKQQEPGIGIYSPMMSASGSVISDASVSVAEYEIGFVQAVISSRMTAKYTDRNGREVQYLKIGLSQQPIRDSSQGSKPWSKQQHVKSLDASYIVETDDRPRNMAVWQTPDRVGSLRSANGEEIFCTWLAARHKPSGQMYYLGWRTWMLDWDSEFDAVRQVGTNKGAGGQEGAGGDKMGLFTPLEGDPTANNSITVLWSATP